MSTGLSAAAAFLAGFSALAYMVADYQRKALSKDFRPVALLTLFAFAQLPLLLLWCLIDGWRVTPGYLMPGAINMAAGLIGNLLFILAISRSQFSVVVPVLSLVPLQSSVYSAYALGENPAEAQWFGIVLATAGLILLQSPPGTGLSVGRALRRWVHDRGALYMVAVSIIWAATGPLDKMCIQASTAATHSLIQTVALAVLSAALMLIVRQGPGVRFAEFKGRASAVLMCGAAGAIAYGAEMAAYGEAYVGLVECIKRTATAVLALMVGKLLFDESITRGKVAGVALVSAGVAFVLIDV